MGSLEGEGRLLDDGCQLWDHRPGNMWRWRRRRRWRLWVLFALFQCTMGPGNRAKRRVDIDVNDVAPAGSMTRALVWSRGVIQHWWRHPMGFLEIPGPIFMPVGRFQCHQPGWSCRIDHLVWLTDVTSGILWRSSEHNWCWFLASKLKASQRIPERDDWSWLDDWLSATKKLINVIFLFVCLFVCLFVWWK